MSKSDIGLGDAAQKEKSRLSKTSDPQPALPKDLYSTGYLQGILDYFEEQRKNALRMMGYNVPEDKQTQDYLNEERDKINPEALRKIVEINKNEHIEMHANGDYKSIKFDKTRPTPLTIRNATGDPLHTITYKVVDNLFIADVPKKSDKGPMHLSLALQDKTGSNISANKAVFFDVSYGDDGKIISMNHPVPLEFTPDSAKGPQCKFKVDGVDYYLKVDKATLDGLRNEIAQNLTKSITPILSVIPNQATPPLTLIKSHAISALNADAITLAPVSTVKTVNLKPLSDDAFASIGFNNNELKAAQQKMAKIVETRISEGKYNLPQTPTQALELIKKSQLNHVVKAAQSTIKVNSLHQDQSKAKVATTSIKTNGAQLPLNESALTSTIDVASDFLTRKLNDDLNPRGIITANMPSLKNKAASPEVEARSVSANLSEMPVEAKPKWKPVKVADRLKSGTPSQMDGSVIPSHLKKHNEFIKTDPLAPKPEWLKGLKKRGEQKSESNALLGTSELAEAQAKMRKKISDKAKAGDYAEPNYVSPDKPSSGQAYRTNHLTENISRVDKGTNKSHKQFSAPEGGLAYKPIKWLDDLKQGKGKERVAPKEPVAQSKPIIIGHHTSNQFKDIPEKSTRRQMDPNKMTSTTPVVSPLPKISPSQTPKEGRGKGQNQGKGRDQ